MIEILGTFVVAGAAIAGVEPEIELSQPDLLVKTRERVEVGVDQADNWVFVDSQGLHAALPHEGIRFAAPAAITGASNVELAREIGLDRWLRVQLEPDADTEGLLAAIAKMPQVEHAELDVLGGLASGSGDVDDPFFDDQWGLENTGQIVEGITGVPGADIRMVSCWELSTAGDPIVIATLDSGAYEHHELDGRLVPGRNIPNESSDTTDVCLSHGTSVAGILAANGDNSVGIAGICWSASVMPIVVVDPCTGYESWVADGLLWAVDNGADVVNMSLQYPTGIEYLHNTIIYAASLDIPMIAATGNYDDEISYPGRWPETIAVGATTNTDVRWSGSNPGPEIDLSAPGHDVFSTKLLASYGPASGTSFAAPHVTAVAAMLRAHDDTVPSQGIRDILINTARDISVVGFDEGTGWGCVNARAALEQVVPLEPNADLTGDGVVGGADITVLFSAWGACGEDCIADLDGDGSVGGGDLLILLSQWTV